MYVYYVQCMWCDIQAHTLHIHLHHKKNTKKEEEAKMIPCCLNQQQTSNNATNCNTDGIPYIRGYLSCSAYTLVTHISLLSIIYYILIQFAQLVFTVSNSKYMIYNNNKLIKVNYTLL